VLQWPERWNGLIFSLGKRTIFTSYPANSRPITFPASFSARHLTSAYTTSWRPRDGGSGHQQAGLGHFAPQTERNTGLILFWHCSGTVVTLSLSWRSRKSLVCSLPLFCWSCSLQLSRSPCAAS
jgi:hypothetical protein